jgi:hypothetical protein
VSSVARTLSCPIAASRTTASSSASDRATIHPAKCAGRVMPDHHLGFGAAL